MKARKNTKTEQNTQTKEAPKDAKSAVAAEDTATTPEASTFVDVTVTTETKTETDTPGDVVITSKATAEDMTETMEEDTTDVMTDVVTEPKIEADSGGEVNNTATVEAVPDDAPDSPNAINTPFSRLSTMGKYITMLEMYEGDYPRGSKMSEFLGCLRPLVFELQLSENIKDNKELRNSVILPGGTKGYKALQNSITHLEARVRELYADIFGDAFSDGTKSDDTLPPT